MFGDYPPWAVILLLSLLAFVGGLVGMFLAGLLIVKLIKAWLLHRAIHDLAHRAVPFVVRLVWKLLQIAARLLGRHLPDIDDYIRTERQPRQAGGPARPRRSQVNPFVRKLLAIVAVIVAFLATQLVMTQVFNQINASGRNNAISALQTLVVLLLVLVVVLFTMLFRQAAANSRLRNQTHDLIVRLVRREPLDINMLNLPEFDQVMVNREQASLARQREEEREREEAERLDREAEEATQRARQARGRNGGPRPVVPQQPPAQLDDQD